MTDHHGRNPEAMYLHGKTIQPTATFGVEPAQTLTMKDEEEKKGNEDDSLEELRQGEKPAHVRTIFSY